MRLVRALFGLAFRRSSAQIEADGQLAIMDAALKRVRL